MNAEDEERAMDALMQAHFVDAGHPVLADLLDELEAKLDQAEEVILDALAED